MKKSIISIDKAIDNNKKTIEILSNLCEGLKQNNENLEKEKGEGKVDMPDNFTRVRIDFKSYYVERTEK